MIFAAGYAERYATVGDASHAALPHTFSHMPPNIISPMLRWRACAMSLTLPMFRAQQASPYERLPHTPRLFVVIDALR